MASSITRDALRQARDAVENNECVKSECGRVTAYPPTLETARDGTTPGSPYWRLAFYWHGQRKLRRGGRTPEKMLAKMREIIEFLDRDLTPYALRPIGELVDAYVADMSSRPGGRRDGGWKPGTVACRTSDLGHVRQYKDKQVKDLGITLYTGIIEATASLEQARHIKRVLRALLKWAYGKDWITHAQWTEIEKTKLVFNKPRKDPDKNPVVRPSHRRGAKQVSGQDTGYVNRDEVPGHYDVRRLGIELKRRWTHGQGFAELLAVTGLRWGEAVVLTASKETAIAGDGNLLDIGEWEILVRHRLEETGGKKLLLPKGNKLREVDIPANKLVATGFDLRGWLTTRHAEALTEQKAERNERALIYPSPRGKWWNHGNLRARVFEPAALAADWPYTDWTDEHGNSNRKWAWTWHSLRDRFACTAVDEWGLSEEELTAAGGWEDYETVVRYYYGRSRGARERRRTRMQG